MAQDRATCEPEPASHAAVMARAAAEVIQRNLITQARSRREPKGAGDRWPPGQLTPSHRPRRAMMVADVTTEFVAGLTFRPNSAGALQKSLSLPRYRPFSLWILLRGSDP